MTFTQALQVFATHSAKLGWTSAALGGDNTPVNWIDDVITFVGRQDNLAIREAAFFACVANLLMDVAAIVAIVIAVRSGRMREDGGV